jgi:ABC-type glycerol-3-phosphate transport system permease component
MKAGSRPFSYAILWITLIFVVVPLAWAFSTSLKEFAEAIAYPPRWIPRNPTLDNYVFVLTSEKLQTYFINSVVVILLSIILTLLLSVPAAYVVERSRFSGKEPMMKAIMATKMLAGVAIIVPLYLVVSRVGLYDTRTALVVVYTATVIPTAVWLLRGFVARVPVDLEGAAQIDGCTPFGAFMRVTLPLLRTGIVATVVFIFVTIWNDFLIAYSLVLNDQNRTIQIGIYYFVTDTGVQWGRMMAAVLISCAPILILYAVLQRSFIQGLGGGAVNE